MALLSVGVSAHSATAGGTPEVSLPQVHTLLAEALGFAFKVKKPLGVK